MYKNIWKYRVTRRKRKRILFKKILFKKPLIKKEFLLRMPYKYIKLWFYKRILIRRKRTLKKEINYYSIFFFNTFLKFKRFKNWKQFLYIYIKNNSKIIFKSFLIFFKYNYLKLNVLNMFFTFKKKNFFSCIVFKNVFKTNSYFRFKNQGANSNNILYILLSPITTYLSFKIVKINLYCFNLKFIFLEILSRLLKFADYYINDLKLHNKFSIFNVYFKPKIIFGFRKQKKLPTLKNNIV